jgi:hypothetical protein
VSVVSYVVSVVELQNNFFIISYDAFGCPISSKIEISSRNFSFVISLSRSTGSMASMAAFK